jgi:hypothetical protein
MSLTSSVIIRQAYIRIGAWLGTSAEINPQYNTDTNFEQVVSESFPPQSMWDMLTGVENEIATAVANDQDNVLRSVIQDIATVTSGNRVPSTGDGGGSIIGVWGQVRQAGTGIELTPGLHEDEIRAIVNGPTGLFKSTLYSYAFRPPRIYATVPSLVIDVCTFDYATRAAAIAANEALLFQQCQDAYFYGLMSNLSNEDSNYTALANMYKPLYAEWLAGQQPNRPVTAEAAA